MNKFHKELLDEIKRYRGKRTEHSGNDSYLSSGHFYYSVSVPLKREIAKAWLTKHKNIETPELIELLDALIAGESYEEKTIAGILLEYLPKQRKTIHPNKLNEWLNYAVGWAEVDALCQSNFSAKELLDNWSAWKQLLQNLANDNNINKRRASLVLLTNPITNSDNKDLAALAFKNIDQLKNEKDILITKAISWLLRSLIKYHRQDVAIYLDKNASSLPKIAIRETRRKLMTGKKTNRVLIKDEMA